MMAAPEFDIAAIENLITMEEFERNYIQPYFEAQQNALLELEHTGKAWWIQPKLCA